MRRSRNFVARRVYTHAISVFRLFTHFDDVVCFDLVLV